MVQFKPTLIDFRSPLCLRSYVDFFKVKSGILSSSFFFFFFAPMIFLGKKNKKVKRFILVINHWCVMGETKVSRIMLFTGKSCMQCGSLRNSSTYICWPHSMYSPLLFHLLLLCTGPLVTNSSTIPTPLRSFPEMDGVTPQLFWCSFTRSMHFPFLLDYWDQCSLMY